jgi:tetratricopeptide (TPR) repeat protein
MRLADEAQTLAGRRGDFSTLAVVRSVRARAASARGDDDDAVRVATDALKLVDPTEYIGLRADARRTLGEVLLEAGRLDDAADALAEALRLYEQKGSSVLAERTRALLGQNTIAV